MLIYDLSLQNKIKICNWFHVNKLFSVHQTLAWNETIR